MTKAHQIFSDRTRITRVVCMLLFVVFVLSLTGCNGWDDGSDSSKNEGLMNACWLCPMFERIYDSIVSVAESLIASTARSAISLLGVGYALWLAIFILKYISSVKEPDVATFWRTIAQQSMWTVLGVGLLLGLTYGDSASAMTSFAEPVFGGFVEAGIRILQSLGSEVSCTGDTRSALLCLVGEMHNKMAGTVLMSLKAMALGSLICRLTGVVVCIVAIILMVRLPLMLVDSVFRYGIALCLLPLAVAAYPFKPTRSFSGLIAKMIVEIGFAAMGLAAFAACCVKILRDCITQNAPFLAAQNVVAYGGDPDQLERDLAGPGMMTTLFVSFFLIIFAEVIFDFMQALSGGSGGGNSMGKAVTNSVKKGAGAVKKGAKFAMNSAGRIKDKKAYETANKKEPDKPEKPKDYDSNPQAKKRYDEQEKQYKKEMKKREMASERLQDRGYYARGADGQMHATKELDNLTRNDRVSGPFKGLKKAINTLEDLHHDLNDSPEKRSDARHNHAEGHNDVSDYDDTYGFKGKERGSEEWKQTVENRKLLNRMGGLQGAGDYRHHSAYNKDQMDKFNQANGINPGQNTPDGITDKKDQGLLKDKEGYDGYVGANDLNTPDYSK